jgi:hypothetical protein
MFRKSMVVIAIVLMMGLAARGQVAGPAEQPRTISTTGEAVVYVAPDEAVISLGVESFDTSLDKAKADNDAASAKLLAALRELKIEPRYIQTAQLEVELRYRDGAYPSRGIEGYFARRGYSITLKDVQLLEKLVDVSLKNGANRIMAIDFRTTELRKHRDNARRMAIRAAREKAVDLAVELGCEVGLPRSISESAHHGYWGGSWWGGYGRGMAQNAMQVVGDGGAGGETMPLGQIAVRANVSVAFDLKPGQ